MSYATTARLRRSSRRQGRALERPTYVLLGPQRPLARGHELPLVAAALVAVDLSTPPSRRRDELVVDAGRDRHSGGRVKPVRLAR